MATIEEAFTDAARVDRFWSRVDKTGECWLWTGQSDNGHGYYQTTVHRQHFYVHRVAWTLLHGAIPTGLQVDHICNNRKCVRHLQLLTGKENTRRWSEQITHCPQGHAYDEINTKIEAKGTRACRTCKRAFERARAQRIRGAA